MTTAERLQDDAKVPRSRAPGVALPVAIAVIIAFVLPLPTLLHNPGSAMEEGFMLVFPARALHGGVPNKDFLSLYGPGSIWTLALVYKIFGVNILVERFVGVLQVVGIAVGTASLARWWGRATAVCAVLLSALFVLPAIQLTAIPWSGGAALGLCAMGALIEASASGNNRWAFAGGVLAGLAVLYRLDLALAVVLGSVAALSRVGAPLRRRAIAGLAVGVAPYLLHIVLAGPAAAWRGMVVEPMFRMRSTRGLPIPPDPNHLIGVARSIVFVDRWWPIPRLSPAQQLFAWFILVCAALVVLLVIAVWAVRSAPGDFRARVLLTGALFSVGIFPQALQRPDGAHFGWVCGVIVALLPAAIVEAATLRHPRWRMERVGVVAGIGVIVATALLIPSYTARRYIALVQDVPHGADAIGITNEGRTFYFGNDPSYARSLKALLHDVEENVRPGSRIIVGNTDMRRTPYNDSFLYYLLPRYKPGTYFIEFEPGITNAKGTRLTGEMRRADAFIASDRWLSWDEPNDSMKAGDAGPAQVLHDRFCIHGDYGSGYKLYLPCANTPSP